MKTAGRIVLALCALLLSSPLRSVAEPPRGRTLAIVPFYAPERMWVLYAPLVEYLERATGEPWQLRLSGSHDDLIELICAGKVDVALVGPVPLGRANARCGAVPFLVALGSDGAPEYRSVLLTSDPAVSSIGALRGKSVGFFKGSTAAHVLPAKMLADDGLPPGSYQAVFVESQDRLMAAVLSRKVAAAGVKWALYKRFEREPGLRRLQASGPVPNFSFAALPSLPAAVRDRFVAALLGLQPRASAAAAKTVASWDDEVRNGFVRPAPEFLANVQALRDVTERILRDAR